MSAIGYVGADPSQTDDVTPKSYVDGVKANDATTDHIDSVVASNLSGYATKAYADQRDALLATKAYVDAQDALYVPLTSKNITNGVVGLDANGKLTGGLINDPSAQVFVRGPWSPSSYPSAQAVADSNSEVTLYTCPITNPGYSYKPVVFGAQEVRMDGDGIAYPTILVRLGSATGPIIARGAGYPELFGRGIDLFNRTSTTTLGPDWSNTIQLTGNPILGTNGTAAYMASGDNQAIGLAMRANADDYQAASDYVRISFTVEGTITDNSVNEIDILGRVRMSGTTVAEYVAFRFGNSNLSAVYVTTGGSQVAIGSTVNTGPLIAGATYDCDFGVYSPTSPLPRRYRVYRDGNLIYQGDETGSTLGSTVRQWGFTIAGWFGQRPGNIGNIRMREQDVNTADLTSEAVVIPANVDAIPTVSGATSLYVQLLRQGSVGKVYASTYKPSLFVQAMPV